MLTAIGIDFGTTYCRVAVFNNGKVVAIADKDGNRMMPCYVAFTDTERLIGYDAEGQAADNPNNTIFGVKRLIGKPFNDLLVQQDIKEWPFSVVNEKGKPKIEVKYRNNIKTFSPEEICSMLLTELKNRAETFLGKVVNAAVISVPSSFTHYQRQAIKEACTLADLEVLRVINDPAAAALAYNLYEKNRDVYNVLIFDLGGGTLDVCILTIEDDVVEVKATTGNIHLGGEDFDSRMVNHFVEEYKQKYNTDLSTYKSVLRKVKCDCEKAKRMLSHSSEASIMGPNRFSSSITQKRFKALNKDLFVDAIESVRKCLQDAKMDKSEIHDIVLIGGSTHIPKIKKLLQDFFHKKELKIMNNDEIVACGAAVQAAILSCNTSELKNVLLIDATIFSIGVKASNHNHTQVLIPKNLSIPAKECCTLTTNIVNQSSIFVDVYEGLDDSGIGVDDGKRCMGVILDYIGKFKVSGISPASPNVPQVEVCLHIDSDRNVTITAAEIINGNKNKLTVAAEITDINLSAETETTEAQKNLESYCKKLQVSVNDEKIKDKIPDSDRRTVLDKSNNVIQWVYAHQNTASKEEFDAKRVELESACEPALINCIKKLAEQMECLLACQTSLLKVMQTSKNNSDDRQPRPYGFNI